MASTAGPTSRIVEPPPTAAAVFLVLVVRPGAEDAVREVLADVSGLTRAVGFRSPESSLSCLTGIGAEVWPRLFGAPPPARLHPLEPIVGPVHTAVATPGDLIFHLRAARMDLCFELARQLAIRLDGLADVVDEVHGFRYFDERDLLGFVDGTENPTGDEAVAAAVVGDEDPDYAGGSYLVVQKYLHDLKAWHELSVEEQEAAIGRTKLDDIEIPDDQKAPNSHVALNSITDDEGNDLDVVRANMAFGEIGKGEYGTYYAAYARTPEVTERMLRNMFLGDPPGTYDRILDFSTAVTGGLFFVPTQDFLDDAPAPGRAESSAAPDTPPEPAPTSDDHSLGIGSLRKETP